MERETLPSRSELRAAVLKALEDLGGEASTAEIDQRVIEILRIPEEVAGIEHPDGTGTLLAYRLRWIRNDLKGRIRSVTRGQWKLAE